MYHNSSFSNPNTFIALCFAVLTFVLIGLVHLTICTLNKIIEYRLTRKVRNTIDHDTTNHSPNDRYNIIYTHCTVILNLLNMHKDYETYYSRVLRYGPTFVYNRVLRQKFLHLFDSLNVILKMNYLKYTGYILPESNIKLMRHFLRKSFTSIFDKKEKYDALDSFAAYCDKQILIIKEIDEKIKMRTDSDLRYLIDDLSECTNVFISIYMPFLGIGVKQYGINSILGQSENCCYKVTVIDSFQYTRDDYFQFLRESMFYL